MAKIKNNILTKGISGSIGKTIVYKTRNGKTFASKYPDMSKVKPSKDQKKARSKFSRCVAIHRKSWKELFRNISNY